MKLPEREKLRASKVVKRTYTLKPYVTGIQIVSAAGECPVAKGKSLQLKAITTPAYAVNRSVQWSVEGEPKGISVSKNGKVTVAKDAVAEECTVYATAKGAEGGYSGVRVPYILKIVQTENPIQKIVIKEKTTTLKKGEVVAVDATVIRREKTYGTAQEVEWKCEDETIASVFVEDGKLKIEGKAGGKTNITGISKDGFGKKVTFQVKVEQLTEQLKITGLKKVANGKTIVLKAEFFPENTTMQKVDWSIVSSDTAVSINKQGKLKAAKNALDGTCVVRASAKDGSGVTAEYEVTVVGGVWKVFL